MLEDLSVHPDTARYIGWKLCRHFIADDPPTELVNHVSDAFLGSGGHLPTTYAAMLDHELSWQPPLGKWKTPEQFVYSSLRTLDIRDFNAEDLVHSLTNMGQPPLQVPSPAGWPDDASGFRGGAGMLARIDFAHRVSGGLGNFRPLQLYREVFGPLAGKDTADVISGAESIRQAMSLILLSPEFQRR